ncbi:hypothetical protein C0992_002134 [Termitomyces sp. T32_za158]|nr:hypothetical protein C0992_002134 [Termitomyces sp. T32_za158]
MIEPADCLILDRGFPGQHRLALPYKQLPILSLTEREAAEKASNQYDLQLEQRFATYRENANAAISTEWGRLSDTWHKLLATQALLARYQHTLQAHVTTIVSQSGQRQQASEASEASEKQEMQNALRDVGIAFSSEDNSLRFEAGWAAVLAQLEARDYGVMNTGRLHEVLGQLTYRLQHDRETIEQLEQRVAALDAEKEQLIEKYELELQVLRLEISLLDDAGLSPPMIHLRTSPRSLDAAKTPSFKTLTTS